MNGFFLILICVWAVVMGMWFFVSKAFRSSDIDKIKNRLTGTLAKTKKLKKTGPRNLLHSQGDDTKLVDRLLKKYNLLEAVHKLLEQAGLKWHPTKLINACLVLFVAGFAIAWSMLPTHVGYIALLVGFGSAGLPILYVFRLKRSRIKRFEEIFPDSLEFVARSMRAGHAFSVSLEMIHKEFPEPLASEFKRTFEEHNLGLPLDTSLQKFAQRIPLLDVHFFVSAVLLQKRTGGNLAEILDKLAYIIRERFKLRGRIRAISAHGKMTGTALTLIPLGVGVLMFYVNPDYIKFFFTDETGNLMALAAVVLQLIGYAIIRKIVSIEI